MNVSGFLTRQFYVAGSLRNTRDGFALEARNPIGDGVLVLIGRLAVDGNEIPKSALEAEPPDGSPSIRADQISRFRPVRVPKGASVTLRVRANRLTPGNHTLSVELYEVNLGLLRLSITDRVADEQSAGGAG